MIQTSIRTFASSWPQSILELSWSATRGRAPELSHSAPVESGKRTVGRKRCSRLGVSGGPGLRGLSRRAGQHELRSRREARARTSELLASLDCSESVWKHRT